MIFHVLYTAIYIKIVSKYEIFLNVLEFIAITFRCCNLISSNHTVSTCIFLNWSVIIEYLPKTRFPWNQKSNEA